MKALFASTLMLLVVMALPASAEILYGLTTENSIVTFDSADPATILDTQTIAGLAGAESLTGIDARPADGFLYGISSQHKLYLLSPVNGSATFVGELSVAPAGADFGIDFNPTVDRIRLVSNTGQNLRVVPSTAVVLEDSVLNYQTGDINQGQTPNVTAIAYKNSALGATVTALYGIDVTLDQLVSIPNPNFGGLTTIGPLGIDVPAGEASLDISPATGIAYAALPSVALAPTSLYTIDLATGAATLMGPVGGGVELQGIAAKLGTPPQQGEAIVGLDTLDRLLKFYSNHLAEVEAVPITGLTPGEHMAQIDYRPATGELIGLSDLDRLYRVDAGTGAASLLANLSSALPPAQRAIDFNPFVDRIRVVTTFEGNFRINPLDGNLFTDQDLQYPVEDINSALNPDVVAIGYDNNYVNTGATNVYGIDTASQSLVLINPPNNGTLHTVGKLGLTATDLAGFDFSGRTGVAYAAMSANNQNRASLYTISTATGAATLVGPIGAGVVLRDMTIAGFAHSADTNLSGSISLSELLRVIQFYNLGGYQCPTGQSTEDGYVAGPGAAESCVPHASDFEPPTPDFTITLTELLRLVQLYNAGAFTFCPTNDTEDGYCLES